MPWRTCYLYFLFVSIDFYAYLKDFRTFNPLKVFPLHVFLLLCYSLLTCYYLDVTLFSSLVTPPLWHKSANFRARKQSMLFNVRTSRRLKNGACGDGAKDRKRVFIPVSIPSRHSNARMPCALAGWLSRLTQRLQTVVLECYIYSRTVHLLCSLRINSGGSIF